MDGFDSNRGIILIAATNRPETLDSALVRPGRFDRQVVVDRPDITGREHILKVHAKAVPLDDEINLRQIAAMTPGFVGADLANLVNEAALLAARKGKGKVGSIEFQEGVERVIAGPEKRQRVLRHDESLRIAYHEAGHALVARCLPDTDPVHKVSILGRGNGALGYTMSLPESDRFLHTRSWLENTIRTLLGGTMAEEIVYGEVSDGCTSDLQRATLIARRMVAEFGMSPTLGRVSYQTEGRSPFLQGGGANDYSWSEQTAREIDLEVRRVLDESQQGHPRPPDQPPRGPRRDHPPPDRARVDRRRRTPVGHRPQPRRLTLTAERSRAGPTRIRPGRRRRSSSSTPREVGAPSSRSSLSNGLSSFSIGIGLFGSAVNQPLEGDRRPALGHPAREPVEPEPGVGDDQQGRPAGRRNARASGQAMNHGSGAQNVGLRREQAELAGGHPDGVADQEPGPPGRTNAEAPTTT